MMSPSDLFRNRYRYCYCTITPAGRYLVMYRLWSKFRISQSRNQNSFKHLRWSFLRKAPSETFDRVLNAPLSVLFLVLHHWQVWQE